MPPKRAKPTQKKNELDDAAETLEESSIAGRKKAQPRAKPHDAIVLAVDTGSTSALKYVPGEAETDLQRSLQVVDWVISRKIFTESNEQFSLMFFGHESTSNLEQRPNIYVHNEEFEEARIEWIKVLKNEVSTNPKCAGDYVNALYAALDALKVHIEGQNSAKSVANASVTLISNLAGIDGADENQTADLDSLAKGFNALGAELVFIGLDLSEKPPSKAQCVGQNFIRELITKVGGAAYSFHECLSHLKFFISKPVQPRGQPFNLELGHEFSVKMQLFVKNDNAPTLKMNFNPVASNGDGETKPGGSQQQLKKIRRYEAIAEPSGAVKYTDIDSMPDSAFAQTAARNDGLSGRFVEKHQLIKAYRYGATVVPFPPEVHDLVEYPREGKQLQLLQFVKRENLLPQFIMNNCRYILPAQGDETALTTVSALCKAMLELGVVAICRYAYNVNSNPRMACLIPKITRGTNFPLFMHYVMPFRDDFRYYDFPKLESKSAPEISDAQLDSIDNYIEDMMLVTPNGSEMLKKKQVRNPRTQFQCMVLREKALNPGKADADISLEDKQRLLEMISPPKGAEPSSLAELKKRFPLELNENTRAAAFRSGGTHTLVKVDDSLKVAEPMTTTSTESKAEVDAEELERNALKKEELL